MWNFGPRVGVDFLQNLDLLFERNARKRVEIAIERAVGAPGCKIEAAAMAAMDRLDRLRGASHGILGELGRVRIAGSLTGDGSQPEALSGVVTGVFEAAIVKDQAFALAVFEEKFTVVGALQGFTDYFRQSPAVHAHASIEDFVRGVGVRHWNPLPIGPYLLGPNVTPQRQSARHSGASETVDVSRVRQNVAGQAGPGIL